MYCRSQLLQYGRASLRKERFAGQDTCFIPIGQTLVLAEHVADLASAHADVAGGNVRILANVAMKLGHE